MTKKAVFSSTWSVLFLNGKLWNSLTSWHQINEGRKLNFAVMFCFLLKNTSISITFYTCKTFYIPISAGVSPISGSSSSISMRRTHKDTDIYNYDIVPNFTTERVALTYSLVIVQLCNSQMIEWIKQTCNLRRRSNLLQKSQLWVKLSWSANFEPLFISMILLWKFFKMYNFLWHCNHLNNKLLW